MKIVLFCHSLLSDWNHGNAHFLRGIVTELTSRGHDVTVYEPEDAWSLVNLLEDRGPEALDEFRGYYPGLDSVRYRSSDLDLEEALRGVDLVLVHEWNAPELIAEIGKHRRRNDYLLLFHDTHHRSVSDEASMAGLDLTHYDGVLAFGEVIRQRYLERGWAKNAWTWHEAADPRVFHPMPEVAKTGDLVWIGNWGDDERADELREFLLEPVKELNLRATIYGVRYPETALRELEEAGILYGGSIANFRAPEAFAAHSVTVHVPRRPYVRALPGIPTIRVFEALACGIPLISAPWGDSEHLFTPGRDFLVAQDGAEMTRALRYLLENPAQAAGLAESGRRTVLARHTCAHRVDELLAIYEGSLTQKEAAITA